MTLFCDCDKPSCSKISSFIRFKHYFFYRMNPENCVFLKALFWIKWKKSVRKWTELHDACPIRHKKCITQCKQFLFSMKFRRNLRKSWVFFCLQIQLSNEQKGNGSVYVLPVSKGQLSSCKWSWSIDLLPPGPD